jgi:hypothetical protein
MNAAEDGGLYFPTEAELAQELAEGMTPRDYFAAAAITGLLASPRLSEEADCSAVAKTAYVMADAMLKARSA